MQCISLGSSWHDCWSCRHPNPPHSHQLIGSQCLRLRSQKQSQMAVHLVRCAAAAAAAATASLVNAASPLYVRPAIHSLPCSKTMMT